MKSDWKWLIGQLLGILALVALLVIASFIIWRLLVLLGVGCC